MTRQHFAKAALGIAVAIAAWTGGAVAWADADGRGPSFDCHKATFADEKAICASPQLSEIDLLVNEAYRGFKPAYGGDKRTIAHEFARDRRACG